jgi:hypothetical protein
MPQTSIVMSMKTGRDDALLRQLPSWVPVLGRRVVLIQGQRPGHRLYFHCCCSLKPVRVTASKPSAGWDDATAAGMLRDAVISQHESCADRGGASTKAPPTERELQMQGVVKCTKRKLAASESKNELLQAKVADATAAKKSCTEAKRQNTIADARRVDVDPANTQGFTPANKSTAVHAPMTGMVDSIKYWAGGSLEKVFELLFAMMAAFGLKERVAEELKAEAEGTNAEIVSRLHDSVQILKCCNSEEQRQQYRVVLTAAAPESAAKCDNTGMGSKFADALEVNRKSVPYLECIEKRAEITAAAEIHKREVAVGDHVDCKHGTGTLVEYSGPNEPCAVRICIGDIEHIAQFDYAKKGQKGASVRHAAISFAHQPRAERKDKLLDHVKKQVQTHYESHCAVSPCAKHKMRKRMGVGCYITAQMLILLTTMAALYSAFETAHPALFVDDAASRVSFSAFKVVPRCGYRSFECVVCRNYAHGTCGLPSTRAACARAVRTLGVTRRGWLMPLSCSLTLLLETCPVPQVMVMMQVITVVDLQLT